MVTSQIPPQVGKEREKEKKEKAATPCSSIGRGEKKEPKEEKEKRLIEKKEKASTHYCVTNRKKKKKNNSKKKKKRGDPLPSGKEKGRKGGRWPASARENPGPEKKFTKRSSPFCREKRGPRVPCP